jgi:DNA mismatch repair ATPase MutS
VKAYLMHRDDDFDLERELPANTDALTADLELDILLNAMALGDNFLRNLAQRAVLLGLSDPGDIRYRQQILGDCIEHSETVREIYAVAIEALAAPKTVWFSSVLRSPGRMLANSLRVLELLVGVLKQLHEIAEAHATQFTSEGFTRLFATINSDLGEDYLAEVQAQLRELRFRRGVLISAELDDGNKGTNYVLRRPSDRRGSWRSRLSPLARGPHYSFAIADRDEAGFRALGELQDRGLNLAANAARQSLDHILSFFGLLRAELGFYVASLNLHAQLADKDQPVCVPDPSAPGSPKLQASGLYDPCLALKIQGVVGNDVNANGKKLIIVTGANQGGKSTFLRSVGVAQLMMQSGMFVAAQSFAADVRAGVFTHFKREEDATLESGKFDEELKRMSQIADQLTPGSAVLFNESFAATNEQEGSEIARQMIRALQETGIKVFFVTHMYDLAGGLHEQATETAAFLRAPRQDEGQRTFRLVEGEPLATSYGEDLYERIFAEPADAALAD